MVKKEQKTSNESGPAEDAAPSNEPGPAEDAAPSKDLVQILLKVPPAVKDKAQRQADLVFQYGWIESATVKQLFVWIVNNYLDAGIKAHIQARRERLAKETAEDGPPSRPS